jgi:putative acetyltransferase
MLIRAYRAGEELALLELFQSAVRISAAQDYTAEQIEAWAPAHITAERSRRWVDRTQAMDPFVAELDGALAGYADLQADGFIDHFFVSPSYARRGVGAALMTHLIDLARIRGVARLRSDVSRTAQPLFSRFGFEVVKQQCPMLRGIEIPNARMCANVATAGLR